jgi:hypothetical protein
MGYCFSINTSVSFYLTLIEKICIYVRCVDKEICISSISHLFETIKRANRIYIRLTKAINFMIKKIDH